MNKIKVVSEDGKKVKRTSPFTDRDREELQVNLNITKGLHRIYNQLYISQVHVSVYCSAGQDCRCREFAR